MLIPLAKWVGRLFGGFNVFADNKEPGEKVGKIIFFVIISAAVFVGGYMITRRTSVTTYHQTGNITNDCSVPVTNAIIKMQEKQKEDKPILELRLWKLIKIGIGGS